MFSHFDGQALELFHKIRTLLTNVHLRIVSKERPENACIVLETILPLIDGIPAICCEKSGLKTVVQHFPDLLARAKVLSLNAGFFNSKFIAATCMNWLTRAEREEPRMLVFTRTQMFLQLRMQDLLEEVIKYKKLVFMLLKSQQHI